MRRLIALAVLAFIAITSSEVFASQEALIQTVVYATIAGTRWRLEGQAFVTPVPSPPSCGTQTPQSFGPRSLGTVGGSVIPQACVTIQFTGLPSGTISDITVTTQAKSVDASSGNSVAYEGVVLLYDSTDQIAGDNWRAKKWVTRTSFFSGGSVNIAGSLTMAMYVYDATQWPAYATPDTP